jgi:hypothetical protein
MMARYLISFDHGAMDHIPDEERPAVGEPAHAVVQEAMDAVCSCSRADVKRRAW